MVFKRRDKRPWWQVVADFFYPRGGWGRAALYVRHRLTRLPDPPHKIARGIWAGVFTSFTPFYGLHFVVAALLATLFRGNILAALLGTFFGNPLTYFPIGVAALKTGHWLLGTEFESHDQRLGHKFAEAGSDLWHNFLAIFTDRTADWHGLHIFYDEVFFPYMVGGILPGVICASACYYTALPLINAYQNRRKGRIKAKFDELRNKAKPPEKTDEGL